MVGNVRVCVFLAPLTVTRLDLSVAQPQDVDFDIDMIVNESDGTDDFDDDEVSFVRLVTASIIAASTVAIAAAPPPSVVGDVAWLCLRHRSTWLNHTLNWWLMCC